MQTTFWHFIHDLWHTAQPANFLMAEVRYDDLT